VEASVKVVGVFRSCLGLKSVNFASSQLMTPVGFATFECGCVSVKSLEGQTSGSSASLHYSVSLRRDLGEFQLPSLVSPESRA